MDAEGLFFEGNRRLASGDASGAEACFREALKLAPDFAEAYANLAFLLERRDEPKEAEACYRHSIILNPTLGQTHLNLGALLAKQKRFAAAEVAYEQALLIDPRAPAAWSNLGVLYACMKREAEAERCYRTALERAPDYATARFNLSYLLLRQARFEEGWACLEARGGFEPLAAHMARPRWRGEPLAGKSLLIGYESGHGDVLQFCRYVSVLKAQGASCITLTCHPALKTLLVTLDGVDEVIAYDEPIPADGWDFWAPLLSLPGLCKTRLDSIPAHLPYLHADPKRIAKWAPSLPASGLRVGLVWKGSPQHENDADRSLPHLEALTHLGAMAGVRFVSLQKGAGEAEAAHPPAGLPLLDLGSRMADFADAAAIVAGLDLVICVDTAVAHLAGALGKPCWVLLPDYKTDWRWLTGRSDSPWYPGTLRLFRQKTAGDWAKVVTEVGTALERFAAESVYNPAAGTTG